MQSKPVRFLGTACLVLGACLCLQAETKDDFDRRIIEQLRSRDAGAAVLFEQANAARERGDHQAAITLYRQVRKAVPSFTHATRRLAFELVQTGASIEALGLLREAARIDPLPLNKSALAFCLVTTGEATPPGKAEKDEAATLCREVLKLPPSEGGVQEQCFQVGLTTESLDLVKNSVQGLEQLAPGEPGTYYMAAIAHAVQGEFLRADLDLWRARPGIPEDEYQRLRRRLHDAWPPWLPIAVFTSLGVAGWLATSVLLLVVGIVLSRATLAEAWRVPQAGTSQGNASRGAFLRGVYRAVIGLAGTLYYLSLPLLLVVVLLVGGGLLYTILTLGRVPIKLVVLLVIATVLTCVSILKSLVVLGKDEEPGVRADLSENPRLKAVLHDVAAAMGTTPVDSVYLLPGTEMAVMERGGMLRRLQGRTERCLLLGVGVLDGFDLRAFKAVLAHEYGHFVNRDTAGGRLALSVRRSMGRMAENLVRSGNARPWNPAWWFLQAFSRLFQLISQGASRLQEVMADRWAVSAYGAQAFCEGLRHVIVSSVRFGFRAQATVSDAAARQVAPENLYTHLPKTAVNEGEVARAIDEALGRQPSLYDSHPSPRQRFDWAGLMGGPGEVTDTDSGDAWALFTNRTAVEVSMTRRIFTEG